MPQPTSEIMQIIHGLTDRNPIMSKYQKNAKWYVYHLIDPRDGEVFYVGKGTGDRHLHHVKEAKSKKYSGSKVDKIRSILSAGHSVSHKIVALFWCEESAYKLEAEHIKTMRGLTNVARNRQSPKSKKPVTLFDTVSKILHQSGDKLDLARQLQMFERQVRGSREYSVVFACGVAGLVAWQ